MNAGSQSLIGFFAQQVRLHVAKCGLWGFVISPQIDSSLCAPFEVLLVIFTLKGPSQVLYQCVLELI